MKLEVTSRFGSWEALPSAPSGPHPSPWCLLAVMHFAGDPIVIVADDDSPVGVPMHDGPHVSMFHFHDRAVVARVPKLAGHCRDGKEAESRER